MAKITDLFNVPVTGTTNKDELTKDELVEALKTALGITKGDPITAGIGKLAAMEKAAKTKEEKTAVAEVKQALRVGNIAAAGVTALKAVAAIAQTVTGIKALKGLKPPTPPAPPERDVQLLERLRKAKIEAEQPVTPAMQRARESAAVEAAGRGRATARAATAGQLGLYAPLAQATNLGILKQMRAGVQEDESLRMQRQQIFDRLLQQRAGETARIQQAREKSFYGFQYPEFQAQRAGAVGLAQTGISSMLDILGGIPEIAQQFAAARKPAVPPTGQLTPSATSFSPFSPSGLQLSPTGLPISPDGQPLFFQNLFPQEQPEYYSPYAQ